MEGNAIAFFGVALGLGLVVIGAGLGFGAQQIVGDVLAGIFILSERQFGVGDLIRVGPLAAVGWVEGHVEEMTLRVTKVRTFDGDLVTIVAEARSFLRGP